MTVSTLYPGLLTTGFQRFSRDEMLSVLTQSPTFDGDLALLLEEAAGLEVDPYDVARARQRGYAQGVFLPWTKVFSWLPPVEINGVKYTEYYQGSYNPDHAHERRRIRSYGAALKESRLLADLIDLNYTHTAWGPAETGLPLAVGVTMIKLTVTKQMPIAVATPNYLHQDGETFTFAHLVTRQGVDGGENVIAIPEMVGRDPRTLEPRQILAKFNLLDPFDNYAIYDPRISHHVNAVRLARGFDQGERCIMLIDFTPMRPEHHIN